MEEEGLRLTYFNQNYVYEKNHLFEILKKVVNILVNIILFEGRIQFSSFGIRLRDSLSLLSRRVAWNCLCTWAEYLTSIGWFDETGGKSYGIQTYVCVCCRWSYNEKHWLDFRRIPFKYIVHEHEKLCIHLLYARSVFSVHCMWSHSI